MRSKAALDSFGEFCKAYPEQSFWQALRNWSKYHYILGYNGSIFDIEDVVEQEVAVNMHDTFYLEDLEGTKI